MHTNEDKLVVVNKEFIDCYGVFHPEGSMTGLNYYEGLPEKDKFNFVIYGKRRSWQYVVNRGSYPISVPEKTESTEPTWAQLNEARRKKAKKEEDSNPFTNPFGPGGMFGSSGGSFGGGSFGGGGAGSDW